MKRVVVLGNGGHGKVIQDIINHFSAEYQLTGVLDDHYTSTVNNGSNFFEGPIFDANHLADLYPDLLFIVGIGDNRARKNVVDQLDLPLYRYATVIHPSAVISPTSQIGNGVAIIAGAIVNPHSQINDHVILNTSSSVGHDCQIEDYVHISPRVAIAGGTKVREGTHLGIGSVSIPGVEVGRWSTVGAGGVVTDHIPDDTLAVGVPAKAVKYYKYN
ncbi:acetyltransferase [Salicibibacter halophilus]|nr:acetyltransferase [Salicibibacter halophilus]